MEQGQEKVLLVLGHCFAQEDVEQLETLLAAEVLRDVLLAQSLHRHEDVHDFFVAVQPHQVQVE